MTKAQIQDLINSNIASASDVNATELREVLTALLNYNDTVSNIVKLSIDTITSNHCHTVATGLPANALIIGVSHYLECKVATNGFVIGDIVTAPTPYPVDAGRTAGQGIGVQWSDYQNVRVMTGPQTTIMSAWVNDGGASLVSFSGASMSNWKIVLLVNYILQ